MPYRGGVLATYSPDPSTRLLYDTMAELHVGLLLFPEFEVLDMAGPIEVLNVLSVYMGLPLKLCVISRTLDPVAPGPKDSGPSSSFAGQQLYLPTHTFDTTPGLDMLVVPGGPGSGKPERQHYVNFIKRVYNGYNGYPPAKYMFSVCSGSALFALAGVLDGRRATSNKKNWAWATPHGPRTHWIAKARWVTSGNVWTTSGVTAGIDGMVAFVSTIYGEDAANEVCETIEHNRVRDADNDPWADSGSCQDVLPLEET